MLLCTLFPLLPESGKRNCFQLRLIANIRTLSSRSFDLDGPFRLSRNARSTLSSKKIELRATSFELCAISFLFAQGSRLVAPDSELRPHSVCRLCLRQIVRFC